MKSKSPISVVVLLLAISSQAYGQSARQETLSSAGTSYQASNLQIDFTLGQLVISTGSNTSLIITQGFHQSFAEAVEVLNTPELPISIQTYPNPATHSLTLSSEDPTRINYVLYDLKGTSVTTGNFSGSTRLDIQKFASGSYQLIMTNEQGQLLETFKVQFKR